MRTDAGWGTWPRRTGPPRAAVAAVLLAVQLFGSSAASRHQPAARSLDALAVALLVVGPLAWLVLGRWAAARAAVAVAAAATYLGLGYPAGPVVLSAGLALLTTVARGHRRPAWLVGGAGYAALLAVGAASGHPVSWTRAAGYAAWLVVVLVVGEGPRYRAEQFAAARRARVAESAAAETAQRLELARDLHDTVGHSLSMIAVQAGVALHLLDEHPEQARPALTAIRAASKEALDEVRAALSVLRSDPHGVPSPPVGSPGLARVPALVDAARLGGLDVIVEPDPLPDNGFGPLPRAVDAAAYRVVQEALTNVTRHARATRATVRLERGADRLAVEVSDDGQGAGALTEGAGLRGMRERVAALDGRLETGSPDGPLGPAGRGFRVAAWFPLSDGTDRP